MWVADDESWFSTNPEGEDGAVNLRPFLELEPGLCFGNLVCVAIEGDGRWAGWEVQVDGEIFYEDDAKCEQGGQDGEGEVWMGEDGCGESRPHGRDSLIGRTVT